jgi:hypothetical protein
VVERSGTSRAQRTGQNDARFWYADRGKEWPIYTNALTDKKCGFEPLADVAYRMEISQVSGDLDADVLDKAGVSTMLFLGFVEVNTDRTRDVVDDLRNKIGWAVLDEDDGFVISDGGVDPRNGLIYGSLLHSDCFLRG